jgi:hypothetical protein
MGLEKDRTIYLLQKFPPFRVYFLKYRNESEPDFKYYKLASKINDKVNSLITLAEKKDVTISYENFEELFLTVFAIMAKEREEGNEVIVHAFTGPRMVCYASWLAASLTDSKACYIRAAEYMPEGKDTFSKGVLSRGVLKEIELLKIPVVVPSRIEIVLLEYLLDHRNSMSGSLRSFVKKIDIKNLGGIKSMNSAIVKMSYCIRDLKRNNYIDVKSISKKRQKIELTRLGTLAAKTYKILKEKKFSSPYFPISW